jgi:hypothetical protein
MTQTSFIPPRRRGRALLRLIDRQISLTEALAWFLVLRSLKRLKAIQHRGGQD